MGVYNDMANDAGYVYGTDENQQMAQWLEEDHMRQYQEWLEKEKNRELEDLVNLEKLATEIHNQVHGGASISDVMQLIQDSWSSRCHL